MDLLGVDVQYLISVSSPRRGSYTAMSSYTVDQFEREEAAVRHLGMGSKSVGLQSSILGKLDVGALATGTVTKWAPDLDVRQSL